MPDGGAARETEQAAALERRYLRLLRSYPARHREVHQEEMLGVLLAAAPPGQDAPGVGQTVNLVACGLAIRARRAISWLAGEPWQDTLAVVSLISPVVMLVVAALDYTAAADPSLPPLAEPVWQLNLLLPAAATILWLAVVLLGLTGRRRTAAVIAFVQFALALLAVPDLAIGLSPAWFGGLGFWAPIAMTNLVTCSLAFSAGPRRGIAIVGRWRACMMIAALSVGFGFPVIAILLAPVAPWAGSTAVRVLAVLAIAIAIVITCLRGTVDWRVTALTAPAFLLYAVDLLPYATGGLVWTAQIVLWLGGLALAVIVWPVAIASWRGRIRRASCAAAR